MAKKERGRRVMKIISFACVEILNSLLTKIKTQTIRPAWQDKIIDKAQTALLAERANQRPRMFEWFDKQYDLSKPKQFWVYRWVWK